MALAWFLHGKWLFFILLLILENLSSVTPLAELESEVGLNLQCHNDYDKSMFCQFRPTPDRTNCLDYSLNLTTSSFSKEQRECRNFKDMEGFVGECSCSIRMNLVQGSNLTATLWSVGKKLESKHISITQTIKPKTPTVTSVEKTANGDFRVAWDSNYKKPSFTGESLTFIVTYRKKEGKTEVPRRISASIYQHDIHGGDLESSTEYVVSVKSCFNGRCGDSSEKKFKTSVSYHVILWAGISALCICAVIVASFVFLSYVRIKSKFWDKVAKCPNPTLLVMVPGEQKLLQPPKTIFCSIYIDPLKKDPNEENTWSKCLLPDTSSGGNYQQSNDSSSLGYANTVGTDVNVHDAVQEAMRKALPHLGLILSSPVTDDAVMQSNRDSRLVTSDYNPCSSAGDDDFASAGSSCFSNKTYTIVLPARQETMTSDGSEFPTKAGVLSCDPAYHSSEGDILSKETPPDPPVPVCRVAGPPDVDLSPVVWPHMRTDFWYQPCDADVGNVSWAEGSSLCPISNDINIPVSPVSNDINIPVSPVSNDINIPVSPVSNDINIPVSCTTGYESFSEAVRGGRDVLPEKIPDVYSKEMLICDMNPCYKSLPAPLRNIPPTDDDYQAFQSVIKQPDVFPGQNSIEEAEHLDDKNPKGLLSQMPQSSLGPHFISNAQVGQCLPELGGPFLSAMSTDQSEPVVTDSCYHSV